MLLCGADTFELQAAKKPLPQKTNPRYALDLFGSLDPAVLPFSRPAGWVGSDKQALVGQNKPFRVMPPYDWVAIARGQGRRD
jgi:hypothetical protein